MPGKKAHLAAVGGGDNLAQKSTNTGWAHGYSFSIFKLTLIILILTVAAGCTNQAMNSVIASWQNQPVADVIAEWGQPSEELKVSGKHLFVWNTYDGVLSPPFSRRPSQLPDTSYCTRLLEVDRSDKIIFGAWDGKNCPGLFSGWGR